MGESGWKALVEKIGDQLDRLEALVTGLIAGNSKALQEIEHRLTQLEGRKPECPQTCHDAIDQLRQDIREAGKAPRWHVYAVIAALCLTAIAVAFKGLPAFLDYLPKLFGL